MRDYYDFEVQRRAGHMGKFDHSHKVSFMLQSDGVNQLNIFFSNLNPIFCLQISLIIILILIRSLNIVVRSKVLGWQKPSLQE